MQQETYPTTSENPPNPTIIVPEIPAHQNNTELNPQPIVEHHAEIDTGMTEEVQQGVELQSGEEDTDSRVPPFPRNHHESDSGIDPEEMYSASYSKICLLW